MVALWCLFNKLLQYESIKRIRVFSGIRMTKYIVNIIISGLLTACAGTRVLPPPPPTETVSTTPEPIVAVEPEEIEYGAFTEDQLYQAIISELGAQRGQLEDAGENYFDLAIETRDLSIIRRAVQFASVIGDTNALMQLGLLWSEIEPDNAQPHLLLSFQFLENGNFDQALSHMARVIDLGGEMDFQPWQHAPINSALVHARY